MASGAYNLDRLIEDSAKQAGRCPGSRGGLASSAASASGACTSSRLLSEVWAALDRYASSCLEEKRGLVVPNFCRFGWHTRELRGRIAYRPYFQLLDCFCRNYGADATSIRSGPPPPDRDLCPMEEFNFSKAAIRFSSELTKDQMSGSLRQLVRAIGEAVNTNQALDIELSFGKFRSKEKDLSFVFASHFYKSHGLDVPAHAAEDVQYRPPPTFGQMPTADTLRSINLRGTGRSQMGGYCPEEPSKGDGKRGAAADRRASSASVASSASTRASSADARGRQNPGVGGGWEYSSKGGADLLQLKHDVNKAFQRSAGDGSNWDSASVAPSDMSRRLPQKTPPRIPPRGQTYSAREEALQREIGTLEQRASEALRDRAEQDAKVVKAAQAEAKAQDVKRAALQQHYAVLKRQIEAKEQARHRRRCAAAEREAEDAHEGFFASSTPSTASGAPADRRGGAAAPDCEEHCRQPLSSGGESAGNRAAGIGSGVGSARSAAKPPPLAMQVAARAAQAKAEEEAASKGLRADNVASGEAKKAQETAQRLRQDLDEQIQAKQTRLNRIKAYEKNLEARLLEGQAAEEQSQKDFERAAKAQEREMLSAAWREEVKIRDIRKSIEAVEQGKAMPRAAAALDEYNAEACAGRLPSARSSSTMTPRMPHAGGGGRSLGTAGSLTLGACLTGATTPRLTAA
eukprot:TRINITY_DN13350_c0_g1_i1.p1 TRINITY_DN13350_c0_g1~~TRINITY_DN13350_c0_g1_i1.p1  ORF type:complete len:687 (-),score=184.45 TRINITY_DN13350_c0_g1_i1:178-2238(-)